MQRRLGQSSMAVGASSSGASALGRAPTVEVMVGDPPPNSGSVQKALE
jgi:hypothetical protein